MKKILMILFASIFIYSCQKDNVDESVVNQEEVFIQVEAIHDDGSSVYSNIVYIR